MTFHMDSWGWKIAVVAMLIGVREFVRLVSPREADGRTGESSKWLIETIDSAAIAIGLVLFVIQPFLLQAFYIPSGSMEDTLQVKDRLLVSKLIYRLRDPHFQDVVVFRAPPEATANTSLAEAGDTDFIKRCMGTPGDVVYVLHGKVWRRGKGESRAQQVWEPYTKWSPLGNGVATMAYDMKIVDGVVYSRDYNSEDLPMNWTVNNRQVDDNEKAEQITAAPYGPVPPDKFFMLGDHRNNSNDGHVWGFVPRANIVGKAICVFWPPTRVGLVDHMSFSQHQSEKPTTVASAPLPVQ
jgi:signal peptidase I